MVDFEDLSVWPLDKLLFARGFQCEYCETMEAVTYTTVSLENQLRNLLRYPPEHPKFGFLFRKALRKAEGVYLRGENVYGTLRRKNLATA